MKAYLQKFQYMLLLRGATGISVQRVFFRLVSIHAPLARSNAFRASARLRTDRFNTCSSCEEQLYVFYTKTWSGSFNTCSSCEEQRGVPPG